MRPHSSSISSSERAPHRRRRAVLATLGWTALALVALDLLFGAVATLPADVQQRPSALAQYFDYGTSVEGKMARLLGPDDAHSSPIVDAGWIDHDCRRLPPPLAPGRIGVSIFGMSFSNNVATQLERLDPALAVTRYAGPAASPNHSYACFLALQRTGRDPDRVQIIGVLASALPRLLALSGESTSFEGPAPFTFPRYGLDSAGRLTAIEPIARSAADLRDPARRAAALAQRAAADAFYDPWLVGERWADRSVLLRMLRRAYGQAELRRRRLALIDDGQSFRPELGPPLHAILAAFARQVGARGQRPIVLLLQDAGSGTDSLYRLVGASLEQEGVTVIRSDQVASVADPHNFLPDGHFTPAVDALLAQRILEAIGELSPGG